MKKDRVLVTGFGPFGAHSINASWEAVRQLPEMLDVKTLGIELVIELLPVDYEETLLGLCELWEKHRPLLIINVGVSGSATELTLESCAFKHGYHRPDVEGKTPQQEECCVGKEDQLFTNLDVDKLASDLNKLQTEVSCCTSHDAGRFLCEFSYCVSLSLNDRNSLFVHVPDIGNPYSSKVTAQGLCEIISLAVLQLKDLSTTNKVASNKI